jgi:hypothetical protein
VAAPAVGAVAAGADPSEQVMAAPGGGWYGAPRTWSTLITSCTPCDYLPVISTASHQKV